MDPLRLTRFGLSVADVADVLNLTVAEVTELVKSRELPAIRMGTSAARCTIGRSLAARISSTLSAEKQASIWRRWTSIGAVPGFSDSRSIATVTAACTASRSRAAWTWAR